MYMAFVKSKYIVTLNKMQISYTMFVCFSKMEKIVLRIYVGITSSFTIILTFGKHS